LEQAFLQHQLLHLLQGGLDLVVEDFDSHSAKPQVPRRSVRLVWARVVDDVHAAKTLRSLFQGSGDRRKRLAGFLDELACIIHDPPPPERVLRSRECQDLHRRSTTDPC
jgi:hypothetical protein